MCSAERWGSGLRRAGFSEGMRAVRVSVKGTPGVGSGWNEKAAAVVVDHGGIAMKLVFRYTLLCHEFFSSHNHLVLLQRI